MKKIILIVMLLFSGAVMAQPMVWTGGGDGISFNDANNWDTNTKPTASNQLLIENDSVVVQSIALAYSLELDDAELTILSDLTISNADTFGILGDHCAINNDGNIFISQAGDNSQDIAIDLAFSSLFNRGDINIKNARHGMQISFNSTLINEDLIIIESTGSSLRLASNSSAINSDSIIITNSSTVSNYGINLASASEFENNGIIDIMMDGLFSVGIICNANTAEFTSSGDVEILVMQGTGIRVYGSGTCDLLGGDLRIILEDEADGVSVTSSSTLSIAVSARLEVQNVPQDFWIDVEQGSNFVCEGDFIVE